MDIANVDIIGLLVRPVVREDTFRHHIRAAEQIFYIEFEGKPVDTGEDGMVCKRLDIYHRGLEICPLKITEFIPVDHVGLQIKSKPVDDMGDVLHRLLRIPAIVEMYAERPQSQFLCQIGQITTIDPSAQSQDAVILAGPARRLDLLGLFRQQSGSLSRGWHQQTMKPFVFLAVVANAICIKADSVIPHRVHDTFRTTFVFSTHLRHLETSCADGRTPDPS